MTTWVPGSWSEILSGTPIAGTVETINAIGAFVYDVHLDAWSYQGMVQQAQREMGSLTSDAAAKIDAKVTDSLVPGSTALMQSADEAKRAFDTYASEVDRIHRDARALRDSVDDRLASIRTQSAEIETISESIRVKVSYAWDVGAPGQMPDPRLGSAADDLTEGQRTAALQNLRMLYENQWFRAAMIWHADIDEVASAKTKWATLIEERKQAEGQLTLSLGETAVGQLITLAVGSGRSRKSTLALAFSGELWGSTEGALQLNTSHPLLNKLIGSESGEHVWDAPPDPVQVAANWAKLTEEERERLIQEVPWVIGNLPGLPFGVRDEANRLMLQYYTVHRDLLGVDSQTALDQVMKIVSEGERTAPPVQVVALDLRRTVPMVAVGYGDLDAADNLTWQVPGMESDAQNALGVWDEASRNLYREQSYLSALNGSGSVGVISFLSYDTPNLGDSLNEKGVLHPTQAQNGAARLAAELDGTWATRNQADPATGIPSVGDPPRIAVNAHSYGTTVTANALTQVKHAVDSFTMAGSAGLDTETVKSLDHLNVAETRPGQKAIYASHADGDGLAPIGLVFGERANPNANLEYAHAVNYEGAYYYSSDGVTTAGGESFAPTDGHSVIGQTGTQWYHVDRHIKHGLGFESAEGGGYWDSGTQSLRNLAATSLGLQDEVVGGLYVAAE
ncbi:MAG: hypothetical protein D3X82_08945 [Candidatus Leucobacter sulfamidivorax]|nr:hypothetical protein [Candidatus Leucobacter sulfamidivorax]